MVIKFLLMLIPSDFLSFVNFLIVSCYTGFVYGILKNMFTIRTSKIARIFAFYWLVFLGGTMVFPAEITGSVGVFIGLLCLLLLFFKGKKIELVSAAVLFGSILISIQFFTEDLGKVIWMYHQDMSLKAQDTLRTITLILRIPIWGVIWHFTRTWIQKVHILSSKMWVIIDLLALSPLASLIMLLNFIPDRQSYYVYPIAFICLLTGIACLYMTSYAVDRFQADMEIQTLKYQQSYYKEMDKSQQQIRKLRHDMRNHLSVASLFLKQQEYDRASQYLEDLAGKTVSELRPYCANSIVNSVLNSKYHEAVSKEISCFFHIDIDELTGIDNISLCSLFANTLDNAIEAAQAVSPERKPSITLKARCHKGFFSFEIVNSKQNDVTIDKGRFLTSKKDQVSHGFGLLNVSDIVEKYDGNLDITYSADTFTVTAFIGNV